MRLICINDRNHDETTHIALKYGEEYESVYEMKSKSGVLCYLIPMLPNTNTEKGIRNELPLYCKKRFVPLSEIDETTFERNYKKETV